MRGLKVRCFDANRQLEMYRRKMFSHHRSRIVRQHDNLASPFYCFASAWEELHGGGVSFLLIFSTSFVIVEQIFVLFCPLPKTLHHPRQHEQLVLQSRAQFRVEWREADSGLNAGGMASPWFPQTRSGPMYYDGCPSRFRKKKNTNRLARLLCSEIEIDPSMNEPCLA